MLHCTSRIGSTIQSIYVAVTKAGLGKSQIAAVHGFTLPECDSDVDVLLDAALDDSVDKPGGRGFFDGMIKMRN